MVPPTCPLLELQPPSNRTAKVREIIMWHEARRLFVQCRTGFWRMVGLLYYPVGGWE